MLGFLNDTRPAHFFIRVLQGTDDDTFLTSKEWLFFTTGFNISLERLWTNKSWSLIGSECLPEQNLSMGMNILALWQIELLFSCHTLETWAWIAWILFWAWSLGRSWPWPSTFSELWLILSDQNNHWSLGSGAFYGHGKAWAVKAFRLRTGMLSRWQLLIWSVRDSVQFCFVDYPY